MFICIYLGGCDTKFMKHYKGGTSYIRLGTSGIVVLLVDCVSSCLVRRCNVSALVTTVIGQFVSLHCPCPVSPPPCSSSSIVGTGAEALRVSPNKLEEKRHPVVRCFLLHPIRRPALY
jgi:hypothetical protein